MSSTRHDPFAVQPPYHGIYAHGVQTERATNTLHLSGQYGVLPNGELAEGFEAQCRQAILNLEAVLQDAGMSLRDLVKMNFYLTDRKHMDSLVTVRKELLEGVRPAITTIMVAGLVSEDWLIEVDATASRKTFDSNEAIQRTF